MKNKALAMLLASLLCCAGVTAQTAPASRSEQQQATDEDVVRITAELVQTSVVVTDKNDQIIPDLKMSDFEVFDNGKKQSVKFMEYVSVDKGSRTEGTPAAGTLPESARIERDLTARDVKRVIAFVVDDLTIPYADLVTVRQTLRDFVDNKMQEGDLVAIIRTVGGKGLLEQFTSDKKLLRRAIASLNIVTNPASTANSAPDQTNISTMMDASLGEQGIATIGQQIADIGTESLTGISNETTLLMRSLITLGTTNSVIDSLRQIPGRKSLVLFSAGLPLFSQSNGTQTISAAGAPVNVPVITNQIMGDTTRLLQAVTDNAVRSGVVINTLDPRGLKATPGVVGFEATPAKSGLLPSSNDVSFGKGGAETAVFGPTLAGGEEHLSLRTLSNQTGGVAVVNTNDFKSGLDKIMARTRGYYVLAYTPTEKFDNKFHKLDVKVNRGGAHVYKYSGYMAHETRTANAPRTKEEIIMAAARSPLAKHDLDVTANLSLRMVPSKGAELGINLLIDPANLDVTQVGDKYHTGFDAVGFVYDETGKLRGGFSQTINADLTSHEYQEAMKIGIAYSTSTQLPPGYYQLRAVVRQESSGNIGTVSRYVEVPDIAKGKFTMSSIFLYAVDPAGGKDQQPVALEALRKVSHKQDLRYSAIIYNPKLNNGKSQVTSELIISRDDKVIFRQPGQAVDLRGANSSEIVKVGQIGVSKLSPGRYVLTLIITDPSADKKSQSQTLTRSVDFNIVD